MTPRRFRVAADGGAVLAPEELWIVVAPNAYKGALAAPDAAAAIARGLRAARPDVTAVERPMADGGDGTLDVLLAAAPGARVEVHTVTGPHGAPVRARLGWLDPATAVVEMAEASGLRLVPAADRRAGDATSRGTGELVRIALDAGARELVVGVGGSASTDGGAGLLQALGVRLLGDGGGDVAPGGFGLRALAAADLRGLHPAVRRARITVVTDVANPLLGAAGAAAAFGPQKGASAGDVAELEAALERLARVLGASGQAASPGMGAAGGTAFALAAVCGAEVVPGAAYVADRIGLDAALDEAAIAVTGEGALDATTLSGKAPAEVARRASARGLLVWALPGRAGELPPGWFDAVEPIGDGLPEAEAMARTAELLEAHAAALARRLLG